MTTKHSRPLTALTMLTLAFAITACSGGDDDDDGGSPGDLVFAGTASGSHPTRDMDAQCSIGLLLTDVEETSTGWSATVSGEVIRDVLVGTTGAEFSALLGGEGTISNGDPAELRLFGDQSGGVSFWTALEVLSGNVDGELEWSGAFECASLDQQLGPGVHDTNLSVQGTWTLGPDA